MSLSTPPGAASPSQPIFDLSTNTSAIDVPATGNSEQFTPSKKRPNRRKRANCNTSDSFIQRCTDLTSHLGSVSSRTALSGSTSAPAVHDQLATELEAPSTLGIAGPSQHIFDLNPSGFGGELPMVEDTSAAGYEMLQFLNTSLGPADPSQPSFDFGAGTGGNEFITVDNTWVPGYDASGLSQPAFDLDAGASVGEYPPVEEMLEFLSNFLGSADPSQPVFDVGASTSAIELTMVDNAWVTGYKAPQYLSMPSFDFNAGASVGDFEMVNKTVAAGHEMTEFLSTLSGPGDPSQPIFDLDVAADELADNQLTAELKALLSPSAPSGSMNRSIPTKNSSR